MTPAGCIPSWGKSSLPWSTSKYLISVPRESMCRNGFSYPWSPLLQCFSVDQVGGDLGGEGSANSRRVRNLEPSWRSRDPPRPRGRMSSCAQAGHFGDGGVQIALRGTRQDGERVQRDDLPTPLAPIKTVNGRSSKSTSARPRNPRTVRLRKRCSPRFHHPLTAASNGNPPTCRPSTPDPNNAEVDMLRIGLESNYFLVSNSFSIVFWPLDEKPTKSLKRSHLIYV